MGNEHLPDEVTRGLDAWSRSGPLGRRVVANLRAEHFLTDEQRTILLEAIGESAQAGTDAIAQAYEQQCWYIVRQPVGGFVQQPPRRLGRAADRERLVAAIEKANRITGQEAREVVDVLSRGEELEGRQARYHLNAYNAWVTWHENDPDGDPFVFVQHGEPDEVRACLGLPASTDQMLLLDYRRINLRLQRPTVAHAALHPYFEPPMPGSDHGWTSPWKPDRCASIGGSGFNPLPRPEALHGRARTIGRALQVRALP